VLGLLGVIGWFLNLVAIWGLPMGGEVILRLIAMMLFPIGMVVGWL
jgi:hypothetical protein